MTIRVDEIRRLRENRSVGRGLLVPTHLVLTSIAILTATASLTRAEDVMEPSLRGSDRVISLPYGFFNESFGARPRMFTRSTAIPNRNPRCSAP